MEVMETHAGGYILMLVCIIVILILIIIALALYRRLAINNKVDRKEIPEAVRTAPEFESMDELSKQYDPKKDFDGTGFGGIRFDRSSTRKKEKMGDGDSLAVMTINSNINVLHSSANRGQETDR